MWKKILLFCLALVAVGGLLWLHPQTQQLLKAGVQLLRLTWQPLPQDNSLPNPVPQHSFIDTWGAPRGNGRKHEGVDIFAKRGTPIVSNIDAVVWKMEENRLGGTSVWLYGAGGALHYYTHLHAYAADLHRFQIVRRGQIIGYVGNTGNAKTTPPHLHYGIYIHGKAVNPYPLIQKKQPKNIKD